MKRFDNLFLLGLTFLLTPLGALAQVAPADQGTINGRDGNALTRREAAGPVRLTVSPKGHSPIAMTTLPDAVCSLHLQGDTTQSIKLFADEEGIVRFHAGGSEEANVTTQFVLDCEADGVAQTFPLEVRANSVPTMDMPAPAKEVRKVRKGGFVKPALTEFEAAALSDQELAARGYPMRPDPKDSKSRASWLRAVTQPMTFVPPRPVANPGITHGPTCCAQSPNSQNWSGFQLQGPADRSSSYTRVFGTWMVPGVAQKVSSASPNAFSSFWIGLDGANTFTRVPDGSLKGILVQAGTDQDAQTFLANGTTTNIASYAAWTEFLPQDPLEQRLVGFVVEPDDEIMCAVWIGTADPNTFPSLSGGYAWFVIYDVTRAEYTILSESCSYNGDASGARVTPKSTGGPTIRFGAPVIIGTPQTTVVPGYEAEWIMERPTFPDGYHDLAIFVEAVMWGAYASLEIPPVFFLNQPPQLNLVYANSSNALHISMFNFPRGLPPVLLSYPRVGGSPDVVIFDWLAPH